MAQLRPRVRIDVQEALSLVSAAGPGIVAIMGTATWGPMNELVTINSFAQGLSVFKDDKSGTTSEISLPKALDLLYANGAGTVYAVRVGDGTEAKASLAADGNSGAETGVLTFNAKYEGTYGNNIAVTITANANNASNRDVSITDGMTTEIYNNGGSGYSNNQAIADAINASSQLVSVSVKAGSENANLVDSLTKTFLTGGLDGESSLTASVYTTAFDNILSSQDFDILVVPGSDSLEASDAFHTTMASKLDTRAASEDKFAIFVSGLALNETISTAQARTASSSRLSLVAPSVKYTHRVDGNTIYLNGSYLACAYAGLLAGNLPHISPTHKTLSISDVIVDTNSGKKYYTNGEQELLLASGIVPVTKVSGALQPVRGVTRVGDTSSVFYEVNIVRIVDYVKQQALAKLNKFIGDPNLQRIRDIIAKEVDGVLEQDKLDEVIIDYLPTQVSEGVSPDTINVQMTIKPTFAINFIDVTLTLSQVNA